VYDYFINNIWSGFGEIVVRWFVLLLLMIIAYWVINGFVTALLALFKKIAEKTEGTKVDDNVVEYFNTRRKTAIVPLQILGAIYFILFLNEKSFGIIADLLKNYNTIDTIITVFTYFFAGWFIVDVLMFTLDDIVKERSEKNGSELTKDLTVLFKPLKYLLFVVVILAVLQSLNLPVGALIGGVGILGIAMALAAQSVVSDIIGFVSIISTKPFEKKDYVSIGENSGHIEKIGIKQTILRKSTGQLIIVPNSKITSTEINNFSKLTRIRSENTLSIVATTPAAKLRLVRPIVEGVCKEFGGLVQFICCNLTDFASFQFDLRFNIKVVSVNGNCPEIDEMNADRAKHNKGPAVPIKIYSETRNDVLLRIAEELEKHNINMAFPTYAIAKSQDTSFEFNAYNIALSNQINKSDNSQSATYDDTNSNDDLYSEDM
jgi:small-conductance mechanosensitive channel